jgi:hypothetical protein
MTPWPLERTPEPVEGPGHTSRDEIDQALAELDAEKRKRVAGRLAAGSSREKQTMITPQNTGILYNSRPQSLPARAVYSEHSSTILQHLVTYQENQHGGNSYMPWRLWVSMLRKCMVGLVL